MGEIMHKIMYETKNPFCQASIYELVSEYSDYRLITESYEFDYVMWFIDGWMVEVCPWQTVNGSITWPVIFIF